LATGDYAKKPKRSNNLPLPQKSGGGHAGNDAPSLWCGPGRAANWRVTTRFVAEIPKPENDDVEPHPQSGVTYILVNPEIVKASTNLAESEEGCLSVPGWRGLVDRPEWVEIKAQNLQGRPLKLKVDDLLARIFIHELDHLNGVLYVDHIRDREKLWQPQDEENEVEEAVAA